MECAAPEVNAGGAAIEPAPRSCPGGPARLALAVALGWICAGPSFAQSVAARQLRENTFELTLTHSAIISEQDAFAHIAQAARSICRNATPTLGRYRYDASQQSGAGALARITPSFRFVQEVECSHTVPARPENGRVSAPLKAEEVARMRERGRAATLNHFYLLAEGKFREALADLGPGAAPEDRDAWIRESKKFREVAGPPSKRVIHHVTVYENPAGAPAPGIYIAADFQNDYERVPYECGYLMWHVGANDKLLVTRSEIGHVTASTLDMIPAAQRPEMLRKLRCVSP